MAMKAKHAFGALERVDENIQSGVIDSYDVLFVKDAEGKPYVGWVSKDGQKEIVDPYAGVSKLEAQVASELATKANAEEMEEKLSSKADSIEVEAKINEYTQSVVDASKAYTDGKVEAAISEHMVKKYEITSVPEGTLVDYRDKEIRVMVPVGTKWVKQNVGSTGNANMYYMGFKAYAPEGAIGFKEGDRGVIIDEYFDFSGDFAGTDEYGRNYSICWLALASYDSASDTWTYFGKNSSDEKFIGWDYIVEWYNAEDVVIASDCVRINLSNEGCHFSTKPYYVGGMMKDFEVLVDEKIAEVNSAYEIIEF